MNFGDGKITHPTLDDVICTELSKLAAWNVKHKDYHGHGPRDYMDAIQNVYDIPDWLMPEYMDYFSGTIQILSRRKDNYET